MQTEYRCLISNFRIGEFCSWVSLFRWYFVSPNLPGCHFPNYKLFILLDLSFCRCCPRYFYVFASAYAFIPREEMKPQFYKQGLAIEIG